MKSRLCKRLGIEFPLFAFSHCRDVVAEVSKAGGFGVLGAAGHTPESLEIELSWLDAHVNGASYGVDLIVPTSMDAKEGGLTAEEVEARIPPEHKAYVNSILARHGIATNDLWERRVRDDFGDNMREAGAARVLDAAFSHPIKMVVNALGVPPRFMIERARREGALVGALTGAKEHAIKHAEAGVDVLVAAGGEAGGHCGDVATLVLVPEVIEAIRPYGDMEVLAAGGIVTGRQMAACMAMGAAGAWTGSVWLATVESETTPIMREKLIEASSRDAVRVRTRTGKPARQLRSAWTEAWERSPDSPGPLPMPLMSLVSEAALAAASRAAEAGNPKARDLVTYFVGQGVGLIDEVRGATEVVQTFKQEFLGAIERMNALLED